MKSFGGVLLLLTLIWQPNQAAMRGKCGTCSDNGAACVNENQFVICINGQPMTDDRKSCPDGTVCTDAMPICMPTSNGYQPICYGDYCNSCADTNGHFACMDEITFGLCYGASEPVPESIQQCPNEYVCNLANPHICSPKDSAAPSCPIPHADTTTTISTTEDADTTTETCTCSCPCMTSDSSSTTPESTTEDDATSTMSTTHFPDDPTMVCAQKKAVGYFKDELDLTCKKYIYCYLLSGQYFGNRYICQGYFNADLKECQDDKPHNCI